MPDGLAIVLSPEAEADLDEIYEPVFSEVFHRLELLRNNPHMGKAMYEPYLGWRSTIVRMFRIIYRLTPRGIEVVYVRHCKRRLPRP